MFPVGVLLPLVNGNAVTARLMGTSYSVSPAQKGRSTQTQNIILTSADDAKLVMENKTLT
ncbi:Fas cell surface death receptor [Phyllostomus discolor]|uniref:Fas cell surface death receptor n=1 Tax=Phyllostomus discolor TaxID=89673 RepID=A0A834AAF3_9CHIR|nr:Fas cell surface death receptor [Phyllostomus discolor]